MQGQVIEYQIVVKQVIDKSFVSSIIPGTCYKMPTSKEVMPLPHDPIDGSFISYLI